MNNNEILQALCSSATSSCLAATLLQPLDRIKTVKQQLNQQNRSAFQLTRLLVKKNGVRSLWSGLTPTLARVVPGASLYLCFVNALRSISKN
ncbi:Mitochondrial glycine transporter [Aphelenchoides bicaudatus]|nr:Mitochondrial glycine transporter [Aphelenchoides bicaudatus]